MADAVQLGRVKIQDLPWPPASPASEPQKNNLITFNLDKAKSLLQQAGVSNFDLDLLYSAVSATAAQQAQIYQSDLAKIGVNGIIRTLQPAALLDAWHTQTYGLYFAGDPWANLEPLTQFTSGSTTNYRGNNGGYLSDAYTKLVEAAAGEVDPAKRKLDLLAAQRLPARRSLRLRAVAEHHTGRGQAQSERPWPSPQRDVDLLQRLVGLILASSFAHQRIGSRLLKRASPNPQARVTMTSTITFWGYRHRVFAAATRWQNFRLSAADVASHVSASSRSGCLPTA